MKDRIIEKLFDFIQGNIGCLIAGVSILCLIGSIILVLFIL